MNQNNAQVPAANCLFIVSAWSEICIMLWRLLLSRPSKHFVWRVKQAPIVFARLTISSHNQFGFKFESLLENLHNILYFLWFIVFVRHGFVVNSIAHVRFY